MPKRIQSPTSINTYLRCPRKYYLRYIKRLKEKPSIHLLRGKAVHETIAHFTQMKGNDPGEPLRLKEALLKIFRDRWLKQKREIERLGVSKQTQKTFYHESALMILGWLKRYAKKGYIKPRTEVKLFSKTHGVMGIIDAIYRHNGKVSLVDYKTSANSDITEEIKIQMAIYALLYKENFGIKPDIVSVDFLKHKGERRFRVTNKLIQYAANICDHIHRNTTSTDEESYPCKCGGWCENDFISKNGGR